MKQTEAAKEFAGRLAELYGSELRSVVLYGSAAGADFRPGVSDVNLLVILERTDGAALHRATPLAREWAAAGNPPPLFMSEREWRDSADAFPIEYSDIRDRHLLLHGLDPLEGVDVRWSDLRLQCEHELKAKKIRLREHYLLTADAAGELGQLLIGSLPTFLTLFRTILRLAGASVPGEGDGVIRETARLAGFDAAPFLEVNQARAQARALSPAAEAPLVLGYLAGVQRAGEFLDGLSELPPQPGQA